MGIILNRIKNISKSYMQSDDSRDSILDLEDSDALLKKQIDELSRSSNNSNKDNSRFNSDNKNSGNYNSNNKMTSQEAALVLGVNLSDNISIIETAYKNKIKEYHPDLVSRMGEEIKQLAAKKTLEINLAYEILKKSKGK